MFVATGDGLYAGELDAGLGTLVGHVANHELLLFAREEPFPRLRAMSYAN